MSIDLEPELEARIRSEARREGVAPQEIVACAVRAQWATTPSKDLPTRTEADLFAIINDGFPEDLWIRFRELRAALEAKTLTKDERQEFVRYTDALEEKNARRIDALALLASLRGVSLPEIMQQLGIGPVQVR